MAQNNHATISVSRRRHALPPAVPEVGQVQSAEGPGETRCVLIGEDIHAAVVQQH